MAVAARVNPKDFFTAEEWAPLAERSSWKGLLLVAHCWAVIGLAALMGLFFPITIPLAVMIIGARQLGLGILQHDAAHGALHSDPKLNEWVGEWLCGGGVARYRKYHLQHHKFAQQSEDPDLGLSAPFPITPASLRRKIVRDLTGQTWIKQRFGLVAIQSEEPRRRARRSLPIIWRRHRAPAPLLRHQRHRHRRRSAWPACWSAATGGGAGSRSGFCRARPGSRW